MRHPCLSISALFTAILINISGCDSNNSRDTFHTQLIAFGTEIEIILDGLPAEQAHALTNSMEHQLNNMNQAWHAWHPSTLSAIHQACVSGEPLNIDAQIEALIVQAQQFYLQSQRLFNPASGQLIGLWGFLNDNPTQSRPPPSTSEITHTLQQLASMDDLSIENQQLTCDNAQLRLDFGGFAKGFALEELIKFVKQHGVSNALINAGGDLKAIGLYQGRPWQIGIEHPLTGQPLALIQHEHQDAIMTSGINERYFQYQAQTYHHILDPRTGRPTTDTLMVTVIHSDATLADAAATALVIAGPTDWQAIARQMNVDKVLLLDSDGMLHLSQAMAKQITLLNSTIPVHID